MVEIDIGKLQIEGAKATCLGSSSIVVSYRHLSTTDTRVHGCLLLPIQTGSSLGMQILGKSPIQIGSKIIVGLGY
ncbi:hypothetical protein GBA52_024004 [Prunus armeniaca]|nr:hypothetical protein GBA52_024004 [Prunus armeniaca]